MLLASFVGFGYFSVPSRQEIGWDGRLRNDLFCVEWHAEPYSIRTLAVSAHPTRFPA